MRKLQQSEVIKRLMSIHGNKYDYSKIVYVNRRTKVIVICKKHGEWLANTDFLFRGGGCPTCAGKFVSNENSLKLKFPRLIKEYHKTLNSIKIDQISYGSSKKVWWQCPKNKKHVYDMKVKVRTIGKQNCPYCSNKRIHLSNSLSECYPKLAMEFDSEKNKINPEEVIAKSNKKYWWKCLNDNNHTWKVSPNDRIFYKTKCPFCTKGGFQRGINGYFYVHLIHNNSNPIAIKFGITNNKGIRIKKFKQGLKSYDIKNIFYFHGLGNDVHKIESQIKKKYKTNFINKNAMKFGNTETIKYSDKILVEIFNLCNKKLDFSSGKKLYMKRITNFFN